MNPSKLNSEHYNWGVTCEGWHLLKSDTLSVIQELMPSGTSEQMHFHEKAQQFFYILSGTATFTINGLQQTVNSGEGIHILPKTLHRIANHDNINLEFVLSSQPNAHGDRIEIIDYNDGLADHIKRLNYEWLEKYFRVEEIDARILSNPKEEIINKGGYIFYARKDDEIVGTVSLLQIKEDMFELVKMAVSEKFQGHYIGNALIEHCIHIAREKKIKIIIIYSNTRLVNAIHLYEKYGFVKTQLESGHYDRADIKMEKIIY
jgi:mannose-6-phosphate isomerase-like protein (cupin superfamily)/N-acetylglutamate synthase-like GNAT family acetyltransferase